MTPNERGVTDVPVVVKCANNTKSIYTRQTPELIWERVIKTVDVYSNAEKTRNIHFIKKN
jgi:hypothetical protein